MSLAFLGTLCIVRVCDPYAINGAERVHLAVPVPPLAAAAAAATAPAEPAVAVHKRRGHRREAAAAADAVVISGGCRSCDPDGAAPDALATAPAAAARWLRVVRYFRAPLCFPSEVVVGIECAARFAWAVRLKLGGVCCDVHPLCIAAMLADIAGIVPLGVDLFTKNKGCASVWVRSHAEAAAVHRAIHHRAWMGPTALGFALAATSDVGTAYLEQQLRGGGLGAGAAAGGARGRCNGGGSQHRRPVHFPRHLVTVSLWQPRETAPASMAALDHGACFDDDDDDDNNDDVANLPSNPPPPPYHAVHWPCEGTSGAIARA